MSSDKSQGQHTQHAFLVAWGWFATHIGLTQQIQAVPMKQKRYRHAQQSKVLEFLVAILAGSKHLQDISRSAHPLDKDQAVAQAWEQSDWADYSGVSRTLSGMGWEEAHQIAEVLEQISQPHLDAELKLLRTEGKRIRYDGDLTGIPVSNSSKSYPNVAFGHMNDEIRLGYQAALVSLESPTYGRLWLSVTRHPGDTVSCTQTERLILAAEARTGLRPWRRTDRLRDRMQAVEQQMTQTRQRWETQNDAVLRARERWMESKRETELRQRECDELVDQYRAGNRPERPTSRLAQARQRVRASTKRSQSRQKTWQQAERRLKKTTACCERSRVGYHGPTSDPFRTGKCRQS